MRVARVTLQSRVPWVLEPQIRGYFFRQRWDRGTLCNTRFYTQTVLDSLRNIVDSKSATEFAKLLQTVISSIGLHSRQSRRGHPYQKSWLHRCVDMYRSIGSPGDLALAIILVGPNIWASYLFSFHCLVSLEVLARPGFRCSQKKHMHIDATWRIPLKRPCAATMWPFLSITLTTCYYTILERPQSRRTDPLRPACHYLPCNDHAQPAADKAPTSVTEYLVNCEINSSTDDDDHHHQ